MSTGPLLKSGVHGQLGSMKPPAKQQIPYAHRVALLCCFVVMSLTAATQALWPYFVAAATIGLGLVVLTARKENPTVKEVILLAVLFRLVLIPLLPSLSDDAYRYVWDGMLQAEGFNPYLYRPADEILQSFHHLEIFPLLNSSEYFSVYPPVSQIVFVLASWISPDDWPWGIILIKLLVTSIEVTGLIAISSIVEARKLVLYAWNPLVIVEVAGQGHTEGMAVGFIFLTIWALKLKRPKAALAAITGAIWVKLLPVLILPFVLHRTGWKHLWIPIGLSVVLVFPYYDPDAFANVVSSLSLYVHLFEFNAGLYLALKWIGYESIRVSGIERVLGLGLALAFLGVVTMLYVRDSRHRLEFSTILAVIFGGYVIFTTTVHPWYLIPILAIVPMMSVGRSAWLWLSATSVGTYLSYSHGVYWPLIWIGWGGVLIVGLWHWLPAWTSFSTAIARILRKRAVDKVGWVRPFLPMTIDTCEILDLGAGEGYVGQVLEDSLGFTSPGSDFTIPGCKVILCDVRDANRTDLPYEVYDGERLPFDDKSFDATLLIFVLHHSAHPARVIQEARRVTRDRVIIIESVYEGLIDHAFLKIADRVANRLRSGGAMTEQEEYLHFRTIDEWINLIERDGGVLQSIRRWGKVHKHSLLVIDCQSSGPRREFTVQSVGNG